MAADRLENIVALSKRRGFVYPSSEIYGGLRASWDYGPLGVELKNNVKRQWWRTMVQGREDVVGIDSSVILAREVWEASGHVETFTDPLTECQECHKRFRADHLEENFEAKNKRKPASLDEVNCPNCGNKGKFTVPRQFSGLLKTYLGAVEDESGLAYLRPETAQGIFINFENVQMTSRKKPPFGIGQIGKSFRNEITPGNFIFRTREFEQMEMEFFCVPGTDEEWHQYWIDLRLDWYKNLGINPDRLRLFEHPKEKLSHYSKRTVDIEYKFDFAGTEWGELEGIASRTDFDLSRHQTFSKKKMQYFDTEINQHYVPYVIETSIGLDRMFLLLLANAYEEQTIQKEDGTTDARVVLHLPAKLAPIKLAILPLTKKDGLPELAKQVMDDCKKSFHCFFEEKDAIGKRYRRQDAIGTPFCLTIDHQTKEDGTATIRYRDSMLQERIALDKVKALVLSNID